MSKTRIAFVGHYLFFSDVTKSRLASLGEVEYLDQDPNEEFLKECALKFDVIATWGKVTKEVLRVGKKLQFINLLSTGYFEHNLASNITEADLSIAGVLVSYTPSYSTEAVANYTVASALATIHKLFFSDKVLRSDQVLGTFQTRAYSKYNVGILGAGEIGANTAVKFSALGFKVQYFSHSQIDIPYPRVASIEELFKSSDILSVHLALTAETRELIGSNLLALLPRDAILINSARAQIFKITDLIEYLVRNSGAYAVVDQRAPFAEYLADVPPNLKITPHIAYDNLDAHYKRTALATDNIEAFLKGNPQNLVQLA